MKPFYPPGRYVCRIIGQGLGQTSKNNVQLVLSFIVLGTPDPNDPNKYVPVQSQLERRFYRVLNDNTMPMALEDLRALGFEGTSFAQLDSKHPKAFSFKDLLIDMNCDHGINQNTGEPREEWAIARSTPLVQEEATPDKVRELDLVFGKQLAGLKQQKPKQEAAPVTAGRGLEVTDEDVPF